ncbi:radical SAM protein [Anaerovibrio lipolyticus]|uniref:Radical SAM protein n=1 Tax=Anaerovibrio lipolyticus TaxID=82374 RepID=A0A0B2JP06_9FIRM|nr:AmmeMemoRadiSam system radical SAM enzyme [Anaerovibrio lipolyticus]KHM48418.1 radical SAM protein [Anaerovibrio lipolyticus]
MNKENSMVQCGLCPHKCNLNPNKTGLCGTRKNIDGNIKSISYGQVTSLAVDPIEKKPLYHFYPGTTILSVGGFGCNMKCPFCQNYSISQQGIEVSQGYVSPEEMVEFARKATLKAGSIGVAFTYNEPFLSYEYLLDVAPLLKAEGQKVVLVTNGQICQEPLQAILPYIDAMNIDLKAFSEDGYKWMGGDFKTTKDTIRLSLETGVHVEVTTLVIPGINDDSDMMRSEAMWISQLRKDIPLHLSRYFPRYKLQTEATPVATLYRLQEISQEYLDYVYLGNV